jgi:hypothetical protein
MLRIALVDFFASGIRRRPAQGTGSVFRIFSTTFSEVMFSASAS